MGRMDNLEYNEELTKIEKRHVYDISLKRQNKNLLIMVNKLHEKETWFNSKQFSNILSGIEERMIILFKIEDAYMKHYNYPDMKKHINDHQEIIRQVAQFNYNLKKKESFNAWQVHLFIIGWLVDHELNFGLNFKSFINKKSSDNIGVTGKKSMSPLKQINITFKQS